VDVASNNTPNERGIAIENTHDVIPDCGDGVNTTQSSRVNTRASPRGAQPTRLTDPKSLR